MTVENAIVLLMTFLVLGLVGIPLLRERELEEDLVVEEGYENPERDRMLSRKETALEAIRELEFDHAAGSLSDEDFAELMEKYERKAISVLKNLKKIGEVGINGRERDKSGRTMKAARAIHGDGRRPRGFACPECGTPGRDADRFCSSCGAGLSVYEDGGLTTSSIQPIRQTRRVSKRKKIAGNGSKEV